MVGNRDLRDVNRGVLTGTVRRFFEMLEEAIVRAVAESRGLHSPGPYTDEPPALFLVDSLAEGADQLVAEAALAVGFQYRLRCPVPFDMDTYKSFFSFEREKSIATFNQITGDVEHDSIVVELACWKGEDHRSDAYAAAADVLLDSADLLLAIYDPSATGGEGGSADTVHKALETGLPVVGVDIREPDKLVLVHSPRRTQGATDVDADAVHGLVSAILTPPDPAGLRRYLNEPLITGSPLTRSLLLLLSRVYGLFWSAIPWVGSMVAALRPKADDSATVSLVLPSGEDAGQVRIIEEVQQPYRDRMAPVDSLARFYMKLYRGSFVMNFIVGALAVLFGLLSYFHHAQAALWLRAEILALAIILTNYVGARTWDWHGRALDYRFIAEYLRQMVVLAPLGRSAPLIRPAAQYHEHDPTGTWMAWFVRALDRDQGMIHFESSSVPTVLRIDEAFVETMRSRLCRNWLTAQIKYYRALQRKFHGAIAVVRALMMLLFVAIAAGVGAHLIHVEIPLDESSWREGTLLTIVVVALPALLGALHGIAVQGELEKTADRAGDMSAHLADALARMSHASITEGVSATELSDQAVEAARMMLAEVLDWRIIHQAHEVELT